MDIDADLLFRIKMHMSSPRILISRMLRRVSNIIITSLVDLGMAKKAGKNKNRRWSFLSHTKKFGKGSSSSHSDKGWQGHKIDI